MENKLNKLQKKLDKDPKKKASLFSLYSLATLDKCPFCQKKFDKGFLYYSDKISYNSEFMYHLNESHGLPLDFTSQIPEMLENRYNEKNK